MIVLDHSKSRLTDIADMVLPVACVSESAGHYVNYQGLMQAFYSAHCAQRPILVNWQWLNFLATKLFNKTLLNDASFNELFLQNKKQSDFKFNLDSLNALYHYFADHGEAWAVQILQQLSVQAQGEEEYSTGEAVDVLAQQTHRASGRTAQFSNHTMHEPQALKSQHNYLNFSMENNSVKTTSEQAFTWAPSWNSNQAVLQSQQPVNGELACTVNDNYLTFIFNDHIEQHISLLWPSTVTYEQALSEKVTLIQNLPWFLVDEQAKSLPEFILMFTGNEIQISDVLAKSMKWQANQVLKIKVYGISVYGIIKVNNALNSNVILVSIFELSNAVNNIVLNIEEICIATSDEAINFEQLQQVRYQEAKQEQQNILERLKTTDQHIPITVCPSSVINDKQTGNMLRSRDD